MSLTVSPELLAAAERGQVGEPEFLDCVRESLPYAYALVERLAGELPSAAGVFVDNQVPPPDERAQGELLRAMASTSIRGALERRFGVALAFQNCHRVAAFRPSAVDGPEHKRFVSVTGQLLNQQPGFVNC
ncbi:SCO5389 family protein [Frankia sp. AiPa1]|uniref:SCO5389 family protein n=1 Tax=Frankia sp. AiPa1 TaxID=573492 RepID=UPI00202B9911|nr:SCO5389 family protein [Frankia sp. AiPa1]MCL9759438.1 SCO5389 family protein [Frankia sp. AiPa1]